MLTAKEARELSNKGNTRLDSFFSWVEAESRLHNTDGNYSGNLEQNDLDCIRKLGYKIFWNRPCLWYEVYWEMENE